LLLDHAGPYTFEPAEKPRGVGRHPHRGFETVTIVYDGEVEHGDSAGNHGVIGPGDVQWMTAASGVVHEEFHSHAYTGRGGPFEVVQLWVNLPAEHKMAAPGYQGILAAEIPETALPGGAGALRVIAGSHDGAAGPARTFTPMNVWDLRIAAKSLVELPAPSGHNTLLAVLRGGIRVEETEAGPAGLVVFDRSGEGIRLAAREDTTALFLSGEPIDEPVVGQGPFVMNTEAQLRQAFDDFRLGRLGVPAE
jgi:hypothetical protein